MNESGDVTRCVAHLELDAVAGERMELTAVT